MHNLFLKIASWIVKRLWIDGGKISKDDLKIMERQAEAIKLPVNMSQIRALISFSNYQTELISFGIRLVLVF